MKSGQATVGQLDLTKLGDYLAGKVEGFTEEFTATKFDGGQSNPTFKLQTKAGDYVLRKQPPGKLLKSAHAVDREFRVLQALHHSSVPVPQVHHLCEDTAVLGTLFYIMECVDGKVYWNSALPEIADNPTRGTMYDEMNKALCHLHSINIEASGLADYGNPGNYFERQFARWSKQYHLSATHPIEAMNQLIDWLETHMPADDGKVALVHGDFRLDNMIFANDAPQIKAILDWELSTLGHPFADLAYQCMQLRLPANIGHAPGLGGVDRQALGIPEEQEYVARYCERMGLQTIDNWPFYLAFSFFRLAAIAQGVAKRALDGNASNQQAAKVGAMVQPLAEYAIELIDQE